MKKIFYVYGLIFVQPRRWLFRKMIQNSRLRWIPRRTYFETIQYPNLHWWILYKTVFNFCYWLLTDAWRYFCKWSNVRETYPLIAHIIKRIGETTAGQPSHGMYECEHCGFAAGGYDRLAEDESTKISNVHCVSNDYGSGEEWTETTTCPICGYVEEHDNGSL